MNQGRILAVGDIHGAYKALKQVLERADFDPDGDTLICLGDVADGWPETHQCIDFLLTIPNLIYIIGNHDEWLRDWVRFGDEPPIWTSQGGEASIKSYGGRFDPTVWKRVPREHLYFLEDALPYYIDKDRNFCYVHGGWPFGEGPEEHPEGVLTWDRSLWSRARREQTKLTKFDRVFLGHTSVGKEPEKYGEIWNLDTGAGWHGVLTVMDVDTEEYWQSDPTPELYSEYKGRR